MPIRNGFPPRLHNLHRIDLCRDKTNTAERPVRIDIVGADLSSIFMGQQKYISSGDAQLRQCRDIAATNQSTGFLKGSDRSIIVEAIAHQARGGIDIKDQLFGPAKGDGHSVAIDLIGDGRAKKLLIDQRRACAFRQSPRRKPTPKAGDAVEIHVTVKRF